MARGAFMQALIFQGPGRKALEERPKPTIAEPADAIVKITKTTICGTDLHILKGDVPTCRPARVLGHEGVGFIEAVGPGVVQTRRTGPHFVHQRMWEVRVLPKGYGTRIMSTAGAFWAIQARGHKPSMYAFPTQTRVSTESRTMSTRTRWSC